jgi:ferredoxin
VLEAPDAFDLDDAGLGVVLVESPAEADRTRIRTAAQMCPVEAISVVD